MKLSLLSQYIPHFLVSTFFKHKQAAAPTRHQRRVVRHLHVGRRRARVSQALAATETPRYIGHGKAQHCQRKGAANTHAPAAAEHKHMGLHRSRAVA